MSVPCDQVRKCIILRNSLLIIISIAFPIDNNPTTCALRIPSNLSLYETETKIEQETTTTTTTTIQQETTYVFHLFQILILKLEAVHNTA